MKFQDLAGDSPVKLKAVTTVIALFDSRTSEHDSEGLSLNDCLVSLYKFANQAMLYNPDVRRKLKALQDSLEVFQRAFVEEASLLDPLLPPRYGFREKATQLENLLQEQARYLASLRIEMPQKENSREKDTEAHKYWLAILCNSVLVEFGVPGTSGRTGSVATFGQAIHTLITGKNDLNLERAAAVAINSRKTLEKLPKIASFVDRPGIVKALSQGYGEEVSPF